MLVQNDGAVQAKVIDEERVRNQVLTIIIVCLASITSGAQAVWTSPFVLKITEDKINYDISEHEASHFALLHPIFMAVFTPAASKLNDVIGRRLSLFLIAVPQVASWIIAALATDVYAFYVARVFSGIGDALHFAVVPVYLGEITVPSVRGAFGNVVPFYILGQFAINAIGQNFSVWTTSYICLSLPALFLLLMFFVPESPYYCVLKKKEEEAKKSLKFLRRKSNVDDILAQLVKDVERQMSERGMWKDLFTIKSNRKALFAGLFLRVTQQFAGAAALQVYAQYIFAKSGSNISSELSTLIITGLNFSLSFFSGFIAEIFGRKKSYIASIFGCAVVLLLEAAYFYLSQNTGVDLSSFQWFPLAGMIFYIVFSTWGLLTIPTLVVGELFSSSIKSKGVTILVMTLGLFICLSSMALYELNERYGLFMPFLVFGICSAVSTVLSIYMVPETKGKTLEEIQLSLKRTSF